MRSAIAYLRVSTEDQAREGISLPAQEARIRAWAQANDYNLTAVHTDAGLSGGRADNRPALQKAIHEAKEGTALVVYSLSRLARSTRDAISISEALAKAGADLVSLTERIDTTTAAGKMMFRLMSVLAEFERDQVAERTKMAMRHMRNQGYRVGHAPFGWDLGPDKRSLKPNHREQHLIRLMTKRRRLGVSYAKIALGLECVGYKTKQGRRRWHGKVVRGILKVVEQNQALRNVSYLSKA